MKIALLLTFLVVVTFGLQAQYIAYNQAMLSNSGQQAFTTLLRTTSFALGGVGPGGQRSKGETALVELMKEADSINALVYRAPSARQLDTVLKMPSWRAEGIRLIGLINFDSN